MFSVRKASGLALVTAVVVSACFAQGASAVPITVEGISSGGTVFTAGDQGGGTHVIKSAGGSVSCTEASFLGSGAVGTGGAVNELTVAPNYPTEKAGGGNNCTAFGFAGAHIKTNECTYTFTTPTSVKAGEARYEPSAFHIVCPTGKSIEITPTAFGASVCTQTINAQTPTFGHIYLRAILLGATWGIFFEFTIQIHYTGTGSSCGNSETHSDMTYTGNSQVKCYSNSSRTSQVSCKVS